MCADRHLHINLIKFGTLQIKDHRGRFLIPNDSITPTYKNIPISNKR